MLQTRDDIDHRRLRPHLRDRTVNHTLTRAEREQAIRRINAGLVTATQATSAATSSSHRTR